jgi:ABC-type transport system involved in Fe-S cluster assembly fused permease/ATPase subunit
MTAVSPEPGRGSLGKAAGALWKARDRGSVVWLAVAMIAVSAGGLAAALGPLALAKLVDLLADRQARTSPMALAMIAAYVAALLVQRMFEQVQAYAYGRGEQRLMRKLSAQAFEHMLRLPMAFHLEARSGALSQTLVDGAMGLRLVLYHLVMTVAPVAVQLTAAGFVMVGLFDPTIGLVLSAAMVAYAGVFAWGVARQSGPARAISAAQIDAGGLAADGLMNVEAVKSFTAESRVAARYDGALAARETQWRLFLGRRLTNGLTVALVFGAALSLSLMLAGGGVARGEVTVGGFVLINTYILQLVRPLEMLGFAARDVGQGLAYLNQLLRVYERQAEDAAGKKAPAPSGQPPGPAELAFEDVSFGFGPDRLTLAGVSFRAAPGSTIGIVGPSGAGKSSLLRLMLRLYEPRSGRILLDGRPVGEIPLAELRGQIAVVSQDTILFNDTIAANIRLAVASAEPEEIEAAAAAARLSDLIANLPEGLQTPVGERGLRLSGGEKQRVAIARAALKRARLVLFDEATAALDPTTERAVWQAMGDLSRGATTIVVTHRLATVATADEILVLDRGRIVERGRHDQLLSAGGPYAKLWRAQGAGSDVTPSV